MRHKFKAHQMYYLDGDNPCIFRVDHVVFKNKYYDFTILARAIDASVKELYGRSVKDLMKISPLLKEVTRKDLPLYVGMKCISTEFTKILRGNV